MAQSKGFLSCDPFWGPQMNLYGRLCLNVSNQVYAALLEHSSTSAPSVGAPPLLDQDARAVLPATDHP